jgi:hypothetical protein
MDTGKLLKIIADIRAEESVGKIQTRLQNIVTYLSQNDPASINIERENIHTTVTTSLLSEYAMSDYHALEQLEATHLFGPGLYQNLEDVLRAQAHEVKGELDKLITEREQKLAALTQSAKSLASLNFQSRILDDNNYEIGFILPENYSEMIKTEKAIHDLRLFLDALANAVDGQQPLKIKYVSNGTIEIFIEAGLGLAQNFAIVIDHALRIYGVLQAFAEGKKRYKNYTEKRKKVAEKNDEEEKREQAEKLVDELINKLDLKNEDDKNRVKGLFLKVLDHVENGVGAEVRTPTVETPQEPPADATGDEQAAYQQLLKQFEAKKSIDKNNREIFILQQNNFYGMDTKFLKAPDEESTAV